MAGLKLHVYFVDAFTDEPFKGNPAAVCLVPADINLQDDVMLKIAVEFNRTTGFLKLLEKDDTFKEATSFGLRWFTVKAEIKLCGHATLTSAAVLFEKLGNKAPSVVFKTLSGDLIAKNEGEYIGMDFPVANIVNEDPSQHTELIKSLGRIPGVSDIVYSDTLRYLIVCLKNGWTRKEFEAWSPDIGSMKASTDRLLVLIITTRGSPEQGYKSESGAPYDFVSRCFAPWINIPEDPATGSAQTLLAPYWARQLNKNDFTVRQCSDRVGEMTLKLSGERVGLLGKSAFVLDGMMNL